MTVPPPPTPRKMRAEFINADQRGDRGPHRQLPSPREPLGPDLSGQSVDLTDPILTSPTGTKSIAVTTARIVRV